MSDLRHALRLFTRRPVFTLAVVVTLALGIGANTAIFSLMRAVLLRPLPYHDPDRLVHIFRERSGALNHSRHGILTGTEVIEWQRRSTAFESVAVIDSWTSNLAPLMDLVGRDGAERLRGAFVTPNFFELLGVRAALGRTFGSVDADASERVVVLSDGFWRRRFGGDTRIIGSSIDLISGRKDRGVSRYVVMGVLPPRFRFTYPEETEVWAILPWSRIRPSRAIEYEMVGRLKPGVGVGGTQAELTTIEQDVMRGFGLSEDAVRSSIALVETMPEHLAAETRAGVLLLVGAAGVVMLIACVNVALLLLALIVDRAREIAVRAAVGAPRCRLARQMLVESGMLAVLGAALGVLLAGLLLPAFRSVLPSLIPRGDEVTLDPVVFVFAMMITVATTVLCGVAPVWHAQRRDLQTSLRQAGTSATGDRRVLLWRRTIVAVQVAVVLVLLITASLLLHSFWRLQRVDLGFSGSDLITMEMRLLNPKYFQPGRMAAFQRELMDRVRAIPGVLEASMTSAVPFRGTDFLWMVAPKGERRKPGHMRPVDPEYFSMMRIPVIAGRAFTDADTAESPPVVIVSQAYARSVFGDVKPLGRRLDFGQSEPEIVGVVGDVRHADVTREPAPALYLPRAQRPIELICLLVRAQSGLPNIAAAVRAAVHAIDPEQPVEKATTLGRLVADNTSEERFYTTTTAGFAAVAMLLAIAGLTGVVSRNVSERAREIAIRISLGAEPTQVVRLTIGDGLRPVAVGIALGLLGAWAVARLLRRFLFEVSPLDPIAHVLAVALLALVAALACYLAARRASRVELMVALRAEETLPRSIELSAFCTARPFQAAPAGLEKRRHTEEALTTTWTPRLGFCAKQLPIEGSPDLVPKGARILMASHISYITGSCPSARVRDSTIDAVCTRWRIGHGLRRLFETCQELEASSYCDRMSLTPSSELLASDDIFNNLLGVSVRQRPAISRQQSSKEGAVKNLSSFMATIACVWVLFVPAAWSQSVDTGVVGTVTDSTGAVVPGAQITITSEATGIAQSVVSDQNGAFEVRYLVPGNYSVETTLSGFRRERREIALRVAQLARLNFVLQVGDIGEVVKVEAEGLLLETQSGVTGNVVTADTLVNLPLSGRNFTALGNLTAGVVASGTQFRASGARGMYQQVSFDGVSALNNRGNNLFMYPSVDAVEEFKVQATNYTAEYGGHAGANVQLQLKSGTNTLRGSVFEFVRNDAMDARNFFAPAPSPKPQLDRHQFGGVVGGPLHRNQTFFMFSYEGVRETRENVAQTNVLTEAMRRGDFSGVAGAVIRDPLTNAQFPGNLIPTDRLSQLAVAMVNRYQPLPNQSGANNFRGLTRTEDTQNQVITRIDHVVSPKQKIFGHYLYQGRENPSTPINPEFLAPRVFNNHSAAVQHVTTWSSNVLNEIRFGYMRGDLNRLSPRRTTGFSVEGDLGIRGMLVGGPNGRQPNELEIGFPTINIQGFNGFGDNVGGEGVDKSQTYQFVDNLTLIRGRHALKMGGDVRRLIGDATSTNAPFGALDFTRDISGHAAAAFILGYPRTARTPEGIPIGGIRQWRNGLYIQDDWRVRPNLTVNLGLRYDHNLPPKDINGVSRTLRFDLDPSGPVLWPGPGEVVDKLYFNRHRHWAPRLGFAYQMTNQLVLRGGYGVFNMALHLDNINTLGTNPPTASVQVTNPTLNPVATIANPFPAALVPTNTIFNVTSAEVDRNHRDGYYQNWNVAIGYELSRAAVFEVRYVGAKGTNLDTSLTNFNSPDPDPAAGAQSLQARRPYPAFGRIRMWATDGESDYHSLQSEFKHRGPWGLNLTVAYTLSELKDNQQGGLNASRSRRQNPRSLEGEYGPSADDQRHRLVAGYVWDIPFGAGLAGITGVFLKGWQVSGLGIFNAGSPIFINQDGDTLNVDSEEIRPNLAAGQDPMLSSSERTQARWFNTAAFARATVTYGNSPRNPVVGPGRKVVDLSLAKSFEALNGHRVQFRIEAFNAFNWVNWGNPNGTLGNSNFGVISSAAAAREMQLSLKYVF